MFDMTTASFADAACGTPVGEFIATGTWLDLGPLKADEALNERKLQLDIDAWIVTASTAAMVTDLNTATTGCPCGDVKWVLGQPRTLKSCPGGTCNTAIFGSSLAEDKGGMVIGLPAYTVGLYNATATEAGIFHLGRLDHVPSDGFSNAPSGGNAREILFADAGTECSAPAVTQEYCGEYNQGCAPLLPPNGSTVVKSILYRNH